jgi:hypothetical protein
VRVSSIKWKVRGWMNSHWPLAYKKTLDRRVFSLVANQAHELEKERARVDAILAQFGRLKVGHRFDKTLTLQVRYDIDPLMFSYGNFDARTWDFIADRLASQIGRELHTINFAHVKELRDDPSGPMWGPQWGSR